MPVISADKTQVISRFLHYFAVLQIISYIEVLYEIRLIEMKMEFKSQEEESRANIMFKILGELKAPHIVCNQEGHILFANKAYQELTCNKSESNSFWKICPLCDQMPVYFKEAVEHGSEKQADVIFKDKTFVIHVIPIHDAFYMIYYEDISLEKKLIKKSQIDNDLIIKPFLDIIMVLSDVVESRDVYTAGHQRRVASLSLNIAAAANITDPQLLSTIYYGALLHDIGKIAIPMQYLVTPKPLTVYEKEIVKSHVEIGCKMIERSDFPWDIKSVLEQHHERMDGSGYPKGLKGEEITIAARIVAIADVYEAMSTNRPYRPMIPQDSILQYFAENKKTLFDSLFVDCLLHCIHELKDIY